ncbi:MAG: hypothetical protein SWK76_13685 [Actinomycetota bacterium]|nr:hypothetical protein [Actinomycetota bacterium]
MYGWMMSLETDTADGHLAVSGGSGYDLLVDGVTGEVTVYMVGDYW